MKRKVWAIYHVKALNVKDTKSGACRLGRSWISEADLRIFERPAII